MDKTQARNTVADVVGTLGLSGVLDELITFANDRAEALTLSPDKLAIHRAASDHRLLVQTRDKLYN